METTIEAIFTEVVVLALQTVKTLAFDGLILIRAAITKILLGQHFVHLAVMGLADLVPEGYCFGGGEREAFR